MMIRGVNLGGWLVLERYITPYQFALTDCHIEGNFCWYPNQLSAPPERHPSYQLCSFSQAQPIVAEQSNESSFVSTDQKSCTPVRIENAFGNMDFPIDEKTLVQAFLQYNTTTILTQEKRYRIAEEWLNFHFENFIRKSDLVRLKQANITHVRVPIPHWILGDDIRTQPPYNEIWVTGQRWKYFVRMCGWARELGLSVWPDIHTAPGSQNGFDNSGEALPYNTCQVWSNNPENVNRSLDAIRSIAHAIADAQLADVVTGFGLLNEPFADCLPSHYRHFVQSGMETVRNILGPKVAVYVSDMFQANIFNDGHWWLDPKYYQNTFLDSHYYQVFDQPTRHLSPRQHIAYTCTNHFRRTTSCCYRDGAKRKRPSAGVSRMIGEWSASFDILPAARINDVMIGIAATGMAPFSDRHLSEERQDFLRSFIQAQIVTFEAASVGVTKAWFYWTVKMEGSAFAEWDFLRGLDEGWFPSLPGPNETSESLYGDCFEIMWRTSDNRTAILEEYPDPLYLPPVTDQSKMIDDDVVLSHGDSLLVNPDSINTGSHFSLLHTLRHYVRRWIQDHWLFWLGVTLVFLVVFLQKLLPRYRKRSKYYPLESEISMTV